MKFLRENWPIITSIILVIFLVGMNTQKIAADEINITSLQGQYTNINSSLSALAIQSATTLQKVNDIDNHYK